MSVGIETNPTHVITEAVPLNAATQKLVDSCRENLDFVLAHDDLLALPLEDSILHEMYAQSGLNSASKEEALESMRSKLNVAAAHALTEAILESPQLQPQLTAKLASIELSVEAKEALFYKISVPLIEARFIDDVDGSAKCQAAYEAVFNEAPQILTEEYASALDLAEPAIVPQLTPELQPKTSRIPVVINKTKTALDFNGKRLSHLGIVIFVSASAFLPTGPIAETSHNQSNEVNSKAFSNLVRLVTATEISAALVVKPDQESNVESAKLIVDILQPKPFENVVMSTKNSNALKSALEALTEPKIKNPTPEKIALEQQSDAIEEYFNIANGELIEEASQQGRSKEEMDLARSQADAIDALVRHSDVLPDALIKEITAPQTDAMDELHKALLSVLEDQTPPELREKVVVATALRTQLEQFVLPYEEDFQARVDETIERAEADNINDESLLPGIDIDLPPVAPVAPPAEAKPKSGLSPEEVAANKAFDARVADLLNQFKDDMWGPGRPVKPMDAKLLSKILTETAARYNHPAFGRNAALAQIGRESKGDNSAKSYRGAEGIAQFMPETWKELGRGGDVNDPVAAIDAQFRYMINNYDFMKSHNPNKSPYELLVLTFGGYNSGPNLNVYKHGQLPNIKQTQEYVKSILAMMVETTEQINSAVELSASPEVPAGTRDLGFHDGSKNGKPARVRLVAILGVPSSSGESTPGHEYYVKGANGELIVNAEIAENFVNLIAAAKAAGFNPGATSSFRTKKHQQQLFRDNGGNRKLAGRPGHSMHESGMAVDWVLDNYRNTSGQFQTVSGGTESSGANPKVAPDSVFWTWLMENAPLHGLWQYHAEPWHWDPTRKDDAEKAKAALGDKLPSPAKPQVAPKPDPNEEKSQDKVEDDKDSQEEADDQRARDEEKQDEERRQESERAEADRENERQRDQAERDQKQQEDDRKQAEKQQDQEERDNKQRERDRKQQEDDRKEDDREQAEKQQKEKETRDRQQSEKDQENKKQEQDRTENERNQAEKQKNTDVEKNKAPELDDLNKDKDIVKPEVKSAETQSFPDAKKEAVPVKELEKVKPDTDKPQPVKKEITNNEVKKDNDKRNSGILGVIGSILD